MSNPDPGDVALAKTLIYETTRANRERTPRGVFKRERTNLVSTDAKSWEQDLLDIADSHQLTLTLTASDLFEWQAELNVRDCIGKPEGTGVSQIDCECLGDAIAEAINDWQSHRKP